MDYFTLLRLCLGAEKTGIFSSYKKILQVFRLCKITIRYVYPGRNRIDEAAALCYTKYRFC